MGLATNIIGIIGNIMTLGIFLSPAPTFYGIIKKNAVDEADPYLLLFLSSLMNCYVWTFYGGLVVNNFVLIINFVGLVIMSLYFHVYSPLASESQKQLVGPTLIFEIFLIIVIMLVTIVCFHSHRVVFVGIIADASSIIVCASHQAIWKKVITTNSVEYMHFWFSLAVLSNGICWTIYAILQFDIFILVSSGVGAFFGAIELSFYAYFYFSGKKKVTPSEVSSDVNPNEAA